ncbi:hypothetical protein HY947_05000 [Candidatus Gottesmanbacteria bacterium]|nr:hypothetical protein [Candidatus Gottesmanbacteria bacterium]
MNKIQEIENRVSLIEKRNARVEVDKVWETSYTRKVLLIIFTYGSIGLYMLAIGVSDPWRNAVVPSIGFLLSTLTLPFFKRLWLQLRRSNI